MRSVPSVPTYEDVPKVDVFLRNSVEQLMSIIKRVASRIKCDEFSGENGVKTKTRDEEPTVELLSGGEGLFGEQSLKKSAVITVTKSGDHR